MVTVSRYDVMAQYVETGSHDHWSNSLFETVVVDLQQERNLHLSIDEYCKTLRNNNVDTLINIVSYTTNHIFDLVEAK